MPFDLPDLLEHSDSVLHSILLAKQDRAATLRKMLREMLDELIGEMLDADLCRFALAHRLDMSRPHAVQVPFDFGGSQVAPLVGHAAPKKSVNATRKNGASNAA